MQFYPEGVSAKQYAIEMAKKYKVDADELIKTIIEMRKAKWLLWIQT